MQFKQTLVRLLLILFPFAGAAQSTYLPQGDKANILMERMEIKNRSDSFFNFSKIRPFSRRHVVSAVSHYLERNGTTLSKVDAYNLQRVFMDNLEFIPEADQAKYLSRKPILKKFYTTPGSLYEVHIKDFDLAINPVIQVVVSKEKDNDQTLYLNTRGASLRGRIANKIGFYACITDNQEKDPLWVRDWVNARKAVPGEGFYKQFKTTGYDFFDARGYFTFNVTKYIDVAFGYDRNFIGNGYRSMFLRSCSTINKCSTFWNFRIC